MFNLAGCNIFKVPSCLSLSGVTKIEKNIYICKIKILVLNFLAFLSNSEGIYAG